VTRFASKKASGGTRNPKQSKQRFKGIKIWEGDRAHPNDILVHKMNPRLNFLPGLNVSRGISTYQLSYRISNSCKIKYLHFIGRFAWPENV